MSTKTLNEFLSMLKEKGLLAESNVTDQTKERAVEYISYNSMDVEEGTLFICKGANFKEEYLKDALEKGAFCYVAEKIIVPDAPHIIVNDIRKAISDIGAFFYNQVWNEKLQMIGITGTKGKSTTAAFVKSIMDEYCKTIGQKEIGFLSGIYTYDGDKTVKANKMTTPETLELHHHLARCVANGCRYLVMETSSQALKYDRTKALKYRAAAFLNVSEDHISDREHPDMEDYFAAKLKIFEQSEIACVSNEIDSKYLGRVLQNAASQCRKVITFGQNEGADFYGYDVSSTPNQLKFKLKHEGGTEEIAVSIGGYYNASNALAAIAIARALGVSFENIKRGLANVKVAGRMELYSLPNKPIDVIVDYAHNKLSYETLFENVKKLYPGNKIMLVAGCVGNKAYNRRVELAEAINRYVDKAILTEQYPEKEPVEKICSEIKSHINADKSTVIIPNRDDAVEHACSIAQSGWTVIAAGSDEDSQRVQKYIKNI